MLIGRLVYRSGTDPSSLDIDPLVRSASSYSDYSAGACNQAPASDLVLPLVSDQHLEGLFVPRLSLLHYHIGHFHNLFPLQTFFDKPVPHGLLVNRLW